MTEKEFKTQLALGTLEIRKMLPPDILEVLKQTDDLRVVFVLMSKWLKGTQAAIIQGEHAAELQYAIPYYEEALHYNIRKILQENGITYIRDMVDRGSVGHPDKDIRYKITLSYKERNQWLGYPHTQQAGT